MAGEFGDNDGRVGQHVWDGGTNGGQQEQLRQDEIMRKLGKVTFIQRGEDDEAEVQQVRMELDRECRSRPTGSETLEGEDTTGDDFEVNPGTLMDGGTDCAVDSFLPHRQMRVLLAEDDDSTRHVVGALLRNCSYEVTPASNGLQAWELLQSGEHQFDIVLTDFVMPGLSGISLLNKIMSQELHKRVPVIMMSSHDSMDMVLKCFQKGASDFLVKPVRKNELKNLWQHVWRKCNSSSGSGSGSGSGTDGKVLMRAKKLRVGSGTNSEENDGNASGSGNSLDGGEGGSDNGSGTQMDAPPILQGREKLKQQAERSARDAAAADARAAESLDKAEADRAMGEGLEIAQPRTGPAKTDQEEVVEAAAKKSAAAAAAAAAAAEAASLSPTLSPKEEPLSSGEAVHMETGTGTPTTPECVASPLIPEKAIDLLGGIGAKTTSEMAACAIKREGDGSGGDADGGEDEEMDRLGSNSPAAKDGESESDCLPTLALGLKRHRETEADDVVDRAVIRQSDGSAFSRYGLSSPQAVTQAQQQQAPAALYSHAGPFPGAHPPHPGRLQQHPSERATESGEMAAPIAIHARSHPHAHAQAQAQAQGQAQAQAHDFMVAQAHERGAGFATDVSGLDEPGVSLQQQQLMSQHHEAHGHGQALMMGMHMGSHGGAAGGAAGGGGGGNSMLLPYGRDTSANNAGSMAFRDGLPPPGQFGATHPPTMAYYGPPAVPLWKGAPLPGMTAAEFEGGFEHNRAQQYGDPPPQFMPSPRISRPHPHLHPHPHPHPHGHHHHGSHSSHQQHHHHSRHHHSHTRHHPASNNLNNSLPSAPPTPRSLVPENPMAAAASANVPMSMNAVSGPGIDMAGTTTPVGKGGSNGGSNNGSGSNGDGNGSVVNGSSANGSATGSNQIQTSGVNGVTGAGQSFVLPMSGGAEGEQGEHLTNGVSHNGGTSGVDNGISGGTVNGSGTNLMSVGSPRDRSARREAALNKFRQKRKERCFEKKVRYQSRKKLAEQRPRVRGQFVRQVMYDTNADQDL
eukprot:jgi/Mesen1/5502/ME000277S04710